MFLSLSPPSNSLLHSCPRFSRLRFPSPILHISPKSKTQTITAAVTTAGSSQSPQSTDDALSSTSSSFRTRPTHEVNVLVVGSTGYIGRFVVKELCRRGFNVIAVSRERSGIRGRNGRDEALCELAGATVCFSDVTDADALHRSLESLDLPVDAVVCCLASRTGGIRDSWKIDYEASRNSLAAGRRRGASHFVLLSAICVQKPLLEFQRAKLKFEAELAEAAAADAGFSYSIVRPTAFFKSLGGQVETVKAGKPYVMFGDGRMCACKPISEEDLAGFIADCVMDDEKCGRILPVGGPGKAVTPLEQGELLFRVLGREPRFVKVPIGVMDFVIGVLEFLARMFPVMADTAEFGRIGRYYAAESMLFLDPATGEYSAEKTPSYGKDTLEEFFERVIREGMAGQELGEQGIL
ncbi:Divinyl chlorophyllide a 8-vinyl-reductase, chloroplastic [Apostasia shenzhenica]|uniref:Divinyl chlorophyllide a 8-vinyl-reductase, chloroplastic n=1 Tax=Apostasia shenzhenica TaxID=1088818 RepID=A0A2I0AQ07_9ASPA|nr:Divinyl chlorophyllide a 8-vinyl-reductase, chloroplastic [Apostasia shenzhenica]